MTRTTPADASSSDPGTAQSATRPAPPLIRRRLDADWSVRLVARGRLAPPDHPDLSAGIPAVVPGSVHDDLLAVGAIDDHDVGTAEDDQHWVGQATWAWSCAFDWNGTEHDHWDLVLEGIDTLGEVHLNGHLLGATANMHRRHRFDVRDLLVPGRNEVEVVIHPVMDAVERSRDEAGPLPADGSDHYNHVRKMACNFGWDWGPVLVTAALWRPVVLEGWSEARMHGVRPLVDLDGDDGVVAVAVGVQRASRSSADLQVRVGCGAASSMRTATVDVGTDGEVTAILRVDDPDLWWPVGMGDQPLSDLCIDLLADGTVIDTATRRIGFRTVSVVERPDASGSRWALHVNGRQVAVRGYNWIPDRPFPGSIPRTRLRRRIDQAVDGNANLLRVWGGGIFESPDFFDLCDERGVLVWQDFLFACAAYPETPDHVAEVEAEARQAITDRAHHASLVIHNGNNECVWGWHDWGWQDTLDGRPWGAGYYVDLLPRLVAELDPTRPYLPASPWSGAIDIAPNGDAHGVTHLWDVWNEVDWVHYRDHEPAFVAEMGWCGPATWATMRRAVPDGPLDLSNPVMRHRVRASDGVTKLDRGMRPHFPVVTAADDWLFLAQVNQARALAAGTDHLRSLDRCSGVVVWQLNDCWPVISWSAVDGDERRKPLWYALRDAFAPRRAVVLPIDDALSLAVTNDAPTAWDAVVCVRRVAFDGAVRAAEERTLHVAPGTTTRVDLSSALAVPDDPRGEVLVVDTADQRTTWLWGTDLELDLPPASWDAGVRATMDGAAVDVTARTFLRDLSLFADRLLVDGVPLPADAVVDSMLVTLLPGEVHTFHVRGADADLHADAIATRPVLRAVNDVPEILATRTT